MEAFQGLLGISSRQRDTGSPKTVNLYRYGKGAEPVRHLHCFNTTPAIETVNLYRYGKVNVLVSAKPLAIVYFQPEFKTAAG